MYRPKSIEEINEEICEEITRKKLYDLYHELSDPFMPIFDGENLERKNRKVRKLQEAVRKVHNWFATYDQRIEK